VTATLGVASLSLLVPRRWVASIMRPITRETIIDRRQPTLRWSAVFAGAAISVALWVLLQMLGMGIGLATIDVDNAGSLRSVGIGTTVWTLAAPVIAMFIGSMIAGRSANSFERGVGASHGFVVWSLTSVLGIVATVGMVTLLARTSAMAWTPEVPIGHAHPIGHEQITQAAETTGKILLGAGLSLLISLVAALLGGATGVRRRPPVETRTVQAPVVPPPVQPPATYIES